jgi:hypothetical protein
VSRRRTGVTKWWMRATIVETTTSEGRPAYVACREFSETDSGVLDKNGKLPVVG